MSQTQLDYQLEKEMGDLQEFHRTHKVEETSAMSLGQTKKGSFIEATANVAVGWTINLLGNLYILPMWGLHPTLGQAVEIGIVFTVISVARSYLMRRVFNKLKASWNLHLRKEAV